MERKAGTLQNIILHVTLRRSGGGYRQQFTLSRKEGGTKVSYITIMTNDYRCRQVVLALEYEVTRRNLTFVPECNIEEDSNPTHRDQNIDITALQYHIRIRLSCSEVCLPNA